MSDSTPLSPSRLRQQLGESTVYVLIGGQDTTTDFRSLAATLVQAGVHVLQLRDKSLCDRDLLERGRILRQLTRETDTLFIVNDRPDIALLSEADGVHVGQDELSVRDVRRIIGPERLVGLSTHNLEQAVRAVADGADYLGCGPTFPSKTKVFPSFPGTVFLRQVAEEVNWPAFAIGGINLSNLDSVISTGFCRVAIGDAVTTADDPADQVRQFLRRLAV